MVSRAHAKMFFDFNDLKGDPLKGETATTTGGRAGCYLSLGDAKWSFASHKRDKKKRSFFSRQERKSPQKGITVDP